MAIDQKIHVTGIPRYIPEQIRKDCSDKLSEAAKELLFRSGMKKINLNVGTDSPEERLPDDCGESSSRQQPRSTESKSNDEMTVEERAVQYQAREPLYGFDFLVVPDDVQETLLSAVDLILVQELVFDKWNLKSIEPFPRAALNFHGQPGTGKTLAAHAVASYLKKPILSASYAQIESKYVGDGSKNVEAVFHAAQRDNAILFIDESDSLLSRRLVNVTQGAEQAINSMRSQLLICLESYQGIVIFSTNLIENYDRGFETRMRHIYFPLPDKKSRLKLWKNHLPEELPCGEDVNPEELAELDCICGRDIKNAVIDAALRSARKGSHLITKADLVAAVDRLRESRIKRDGD
ncbi:MAG: ATP-binding protein [Anaerolineales bacterium]|nr:ATP-binding protein [Anaerolineales bacterium]